MQLSWCIMTSSFLIFILFECCTCQNTSYISTWTTEILDNLLYKYDKSMRPDFGNKPTEIQTNMNIRSFGPISDQERVYTFDCYFRQHWFDERLKFPKNRLGKEMNLQLNEIMLNKVWKPDTIFYNGKKSHVHTATSKNILFRITTEGKVTYSQRLTVKASCMMSLRKYPMDVQNCPLIFGSHGYTSDEVIFKWGGTKTVIDSDENLKISQFDLTNITYTERSQHIPGRGQIHQMIVNFHLKRNSGYFLIQIYLPCALLVIMSWIGFWINREATTDRISLGIMTVLTMVLMGQDNKKDLLNVPYSTALDIYIGGCFAHILATIIEFAAVHYFTKFGYGESYIFISQTDPPRIIKSDKNNDFHTRDLFAQVSDNEPNQYVNPHSSPHKFQESIISNCFACLTGSVEYREYKLNKSRNTLNSFSKIDAISRITFPIVFGAFNILYWTLYDYIL